MSPILIYLLIVNGIAFLVNGLDKWLAVIQKKRIPEQSLLGLVVLGGTFGTGIGMLLFRHKTAKKTYLLCFFGIAILQLIAAYFYLNP
jgi:uncharacterized membrane protein YsdA (DUF1294 family)